MYNFIRKLEAPDFVDVLPKSFRNSLFSSLLKNLVSYCTRTGSKVDLINEDIRAGLARGVEVFQTEINIHSLKMIHFTKSFSVTFRTGKVSEANGTV